MQRFLPWMLSYQAEWHETDVLIAGANPLLACLIAARARKQGFKVLWWQDFYHDDWPFFLCQEAPFRHLVEQTIGWAGPDQIWWQQRDAVLSRFIGRVDQADLQIAALWAQGLAGWVTRPAEDPWLGILQGTGRLSMGRNRGQDEAVLHANLARERPAPKINPDDNPVSDISQILRAQGDDYGWHARHGWARIVFARHVIVVTERARPALLQDRHHDGPQNSAGQVFGTARNGWSTLSLADRTKAAFEDILEISQLFGTDPIAKP